jgi:hypothetical protein
MLSRRQQQRLIAQNAKECADHDRMTGDDWSHLAEMRARAEGLAEPQRTRFEELTRKCYVLIHAACVASEEHRYRWAWLWTQKANELFDLRDNLTIEKAAAPDGLPLGIVPHSPWLTLFQAILWTLFGPDSHSLVRYFDHGHVPQWAKESKWTRKG